VQSCLRSTPLLLVLLLQLACAGRRSDGETTAGRSSRDVLTREELRAAGSPNAYDRVATLRPLWLQPRGGPDSFQATRRVWVYLDDVRAGGVEALRRISITEIAYIRYFDGTAAAARWGLDHGYGVIFVSTRPDGRLNAGHLSHHPRPG
jgi:hypothetical protein